MHAIASIGVQCTRSGATLAMLHRELLESTQVLVHCCCTAGNIASVFMVDLLGRRWTASACLAAAGAAALAFAAAPASSGWSLAAACVFNAIRCGRACTRVSARLRRARDSAAASGVVRGARSERRRRCCADAAALQQRVSRRAAAQCWRLECARPAQRRGVSNRGAAAAPLAQCAAARLCFA